jgi:hypothetical protein
MISLNGSTTRISSRDRSQASALFGKRPRSRPPFAGGVEATTATGHISFPNERSVTLRGRFTFPREDGGEVVVVVDFARVQTTCC